MQLKISNFTPFRGKMSKFFLFLPTTREKFSWFTYLYGGHMYTWSPLGVPPSRQSLWRKHRLFSPLGFDILRNSDQGIPKIKLYTVRALKWFLNEKNLILGRLTVTILKFNALVLKRTLVKISHFWGQRWDHRSPHHLSPLMY